MMLWKCCTQYANKFGKFSSGHRTRKGQFSFQSQERRCQKCSNYCIIAFISHAHECSKFSKPGFNSTWTMNLTDVQAGFRKGKGTRDQIANICWIIKKAREFQKKSALLTMLKPLTVWITTNWKILQEMGIPNHLTCLLKNLYRSRSNS